MLKAILLIIFLLPATATEVVVTEYHWEVAAHIQVFNQSKISKRTQKQCRRHGIPSPPIEGVWDNAGWSNDIPYQEGTGRKIKTDFSDSYSAVRPSDGLCDGDERVLRYHYIYRLKIKDLKTNRTWIVKVSKKNWTSLNKGDRLLAAVNCLGVIIDLKYNK